MKKILLTLGSTIIASAPIMTIVSCGTEAKESGGIFTEYVRSNDMTLSLGVASQYHARSDLSTTHGLTNEGYLDDFASDETVNAKRYNGGDKEYFTSLDIGMYIARSIDDSNGYFGNVKNKHDVLNSHEELTGYEVNWHSELKDLAEKFDNAKDTEKYTTRAEEVIENYNDRMEELISETSSVEDKTVILVRGNDDETRMYDGIIPMKHTTQLFGLDNISFPTIAEGDEDLLNSADYLIQGKSEQAPNEDLQLAFQGLADIVIYLKTPFAQAKDEDVVAELEGFAKTDGEVIVGSYDEWYLPFRGAAIGGNVSIDNIYKDIFDMDVPSTDWKNDFKKDDLEFITVGHEIK